MIQRQSPASKFLFLPASDMHVEALKQAFMATTSDVENDGDDDDDDDDNKISLLERKWRRFCTRAAARPYCTSTVCCEFEYGLFNLE